MKSCIKKDTHKIYIDVEILLGSNYFLFYLPTLTIVSMVSRSLNLKRVAE